VTNRAELVQESHLAGHALLVGALAVAASVRSLGNGFAFDDVAIVVRNDALHHLGTWWRLFSVSYWPPSLGESLYRPLTSLVFALQWRIGGGDPWVFHLTSVLMYTAVSLAVWRLLGRMLSGMAALTAATLFAVHPVHVESVANVVGQAELWAALPVVLACTWYVRSRARGGPTARDTLAIVVLFVCGTLFKEHALLLPLLLAGLEALVVSNDQPWRVRVRALWPLYLSLFACSIGVVAVRSAVLGSLVGEQQVVEMDLVTRVWTMFRVVPEWMRLFFFPVHLSAYYGPKDIEIVRGPTFWNVIGILIALLSAAAFLTARRRQPIVAYSLIWLGVTLLPASNLVSGFILEEHTLFLPSVGAMLLVGALWDRVWGRNADSPSGAAPADNGGRSARVMALAIPAVVVVALCVRSALRQPVWKDNATLFAATVIDAPQSYRAHYLYGTMLFETGRLREGESELRTAITLSSNDSDPYNYLATKYSEAKLYAQAIPLYREAISLNARRPDARFGLAYALLETGDIVGARTQAEAGLAGGQLPSYFRWILARADSAADRAGDLQHKR
jgi:hypothetical protein